MVEVIQKSTFENDFIERTYSSIVTDMSIAFSELVANSWDAGATNVHIFLPAEPGGEIIIEDDGTGMDEQQFLNRWMVISYNRVTHQGEYIDYVSNNQIKKRLAYGRNGIGRHALLCFNNQYQVETWCNGICNTYELKTDGGDSVLSVIQHNQTPKEGHGTRLIVKAVKNLPKPSNISKTLGYRFLFDPEFSIYVNNNPVEYQNSIPAMKKDHLYLQSGNKIEISVYQIPEGEKNTATNGIAFWAGNRLIGNASWSVGNIRVEDARRKFAQKHLIVVKADHLINDVVFDWSELKKTENVRETFDAVIDYVRKFRIEYYRGKVTEVKTDVIQRNITSIEKLSIPALYDLKLFLEGYLDQKPEVDSDELNTIVDSLLAVLKARNGLALLQKLSDMNPDDIDTLDNILNEWSVSDIREVLDEVDRRIKVIDTIEKLCGDSSTDELHTLHPLISQARWLFGIEYDNLNYTFNKGLSTVIKEILHSQRKKEIGINWKKRPDLVFSDDFSLSSVCTEKTDDNEISVIDRILIIELKKGGFSISREEINQAEEYIDSIVRGNKLNCKPYIKAYVVGDNVKPNMAAYKKIEDYGEVFAYTYQQLVQTARKRLFGLREKLSQHYEDASEDDYISRILQTNSQTQMDFGEGA